MRASRNLSGCYTRSAQVRPVSMRHICCMLASEATNGATERRINPGAAVHALRARQFRRRAAACRRRGRSVAANPLLLEGAVADDGADCLPPNDSNRATCQGQAAPAVPTCRLTMKAARCAVDRDRLTCSGGVSSTRSRTCMPRRCAFSSARRRRGFRLSESAPAPSCCTGPG